MQLDATVADHEVKYPTDHDLLNESREISERIIDELCKTLSLDKKPRTYRRSSTKEFPESVKEEKKNEERYSKKYPTAATIS